MDRLPEEQRMLTLVPSGQAMMAALACRLHVDASGRQRVPFIAAASKEGARGSFCKTGRAELIASGAL